MLTELCHLSVPLLANRSQFGPNFGCWGKCSTIVTQLFGNLWNASELAGALGVTFWDVWRAFAPQLSGSFRPSAIVGLYMAAGITSPGGLSGCRVEHRFSRIWFDFQQFCAAFGNNWVDIVGQFCGGFGQISTGSCASPTDLRLVSANFGLVSTRLTPFSNDLMLVSTKLLFQPSLCRFRPTLGWLRRSLCGSRSDGMGSNQFELVPMVVFCQI